MNTLIELHKEIVDTMKTFRWSFDDAAEYVYEKYADPDAPHTIFCQGLVEIRDKFVESKQELECDITKVLGA